MPNGMPRQTVDLKIAPDERNGLVKIRFWQKDRFTGEAPDKLYRLPIVRFLFFPNIKKGVFTPIQ